jgi:hypothetical protein
MPETLDLQPVAEALDLQPADGLELQPEPEREPSPSQRASFGAPGENPAGSHPPSGPRSLLEAEAQRIGPNFSRDEVRQRDLAAGLTPGQSTRLTDGSLAENLMTAPPGLEAPWITSQDIQKRFPQMATGSADALAGLLQTGAGLWNFAASPVGAAGMAVGAGATLPGMAGAAGKAALATFALDSISHTPEALKAYQEAVRSGKTEDIFRTGSQLVANVGVALGAGRGTVEAARGIPASEARSVQAKARAAGLDESAKALDEFARKAESAEILGAEAKATEATMPGRDPLSTPEALRRAEELQLTETPTPERPNMAGPETLGPLVDRGYRREISLRADEAVERIKLAKERQAELETSKLSSAEPFPRGAETPGARSAEDRITAERSDRAPDTVRDPVITESTPLKDVEQLVREHLEQRDWESAVTILAQAKAETSRKLLDKFLGTGRESVPLSVAERTIFNETWEAVLEKKIRSWTEEADAAHAWWERRRARETSSKAQDDLVKEAIATARKNGPSPEFRSFFGGIDPVVAGTTAEKVTAFARSLGMEWHPTPTPRASEFIKRLEDLKTPLDPGLGSTPFPQIAKAVWNTGIDIAIGVVKAGGKLVDAIEAALAHIRKNAQGFDEAGVRGHLEKLLKAEAQSTEGAKAAEKVGAMSKAAREETTTAKSTSSESSAAIPPARRPLGELYSEPLVERLGRLGGPVSRKVSQENMGIVARAKELYGNLEATILDAAKQAAGKAFRGGTTAIQTLREITPNAAVSRFHDVIEGRARAGDWSATPPDLQPLASTLFDANLAIGRLAEQANPNFKATGRLQRILTSYGYDIVRRGSGPAWEAWTKGLAEANGMAVERVQAFARRWKKELDSPGPDTASLDRIAQDFERHFPNVVTHVRPRKGFGWHEVIVSSPFRYLEQAAQRTAHAVAFREVYPLVEHEGKMVSSGKLEATRSAVMRELNTSRHSAEFDNVMRALQGHPLDTFGTWWNAPDTALGMAGRAASALMQPLRSLMLSASLPVNIGESFSGGAQIFLGYGKAFAAMTKLDRYQQLKRSGALNAALRDFSFDPTQPARSAARQTSNVISRTFLSDLANEFQEFAGASAARLVADEIRAGSLSPGDQLRVQNVMRAMGIDRASAEQAVRGNNPSALRVFENEAASFLSGGNQAMAGKSRLGASRAFNELFWFHSYPMTKLRQFRSIANNLIEDASLRQWRSAADNAALMGRFLGGTVLGGALTVGIMRLLYEGLFGLDIARHEAQDDWKGFLTDSFLQGMGGPLQIAARIFEQGLDLDNVGAGLVGAMAPVGVARELSDAALGRGRYEGLSEFERLGKFILSKTPTTKAIKQGMAAFGLSQDNVELDAAIKGFYRWRNDEFGTIKHKEFLSDERSHHAFKASMRKAVEALKDGRMEEFDAALDAALEDPEATMKKVKSSLRGRKLLKSPDGRSLSPEDLDALRSRIGSKAVDLLEDFDMMLNAVAK